MVAFFPSFYFHSLIPHEYYLHVAAFFYVVLLGFNFHVGLVFCVFFDTFGGCIAVLTWLLNHNFIAYFLLLYPAQRSAWLGLELVYVFLASCEVTSVRDHEVIMHKFYYYPLAHKPRSAYYLCYKFSRDTFGESDLSTVIAYTC